MQDEYFDWDDAKAAANLKKHKISFRAASRVLDDPFAVIEQDITEDYSEDRFIATGLVEGLLITVAYTERGERIRIISARKANGHEQKSYNRG